MASSAGRARVAGSLNIRRDFRASLSGSPRHEACHERFDDFLLMHRFGEYRIRSGMRHMLVVGRRVFVEQDADDDVRCRASNFTHRI